MFTLEIAFYVHHAIYVYLRGRREYIGMSFVHRSCGQVIHQILGIISLCCNNPLSENVH
jgi:hypothetical protein